MSFKATLFIFDKEYPLLKLDYNLAKPVDYTGRPQGRTLGGKIYTTFAATKDDSGIYEAMFSPDQMVQGYIRVYKRDGMQKDFDIKFANTFVINANTRFNHDGTVNLLMDVEFSALIMKIRDSLYVSPANPSNPFVENNVTPTVRDEEDTEEKEDVIFTARLERDENTYNGEFGFDWMRDNYQEICENYEALKTEYNPITIEGKEYFVPWLSMFPDQDNVSLLLKVDITQGKAKRDDVIKLPATDGIRFDPEEVKVKDAEKGEVMVKVFCDSPLTKDTSIELLDKNDAIVGKINVVKNDTVYDLDIKFVKVCKEQHLEGLKDKFDRNLDRIEDFLINGSLNQALIKPKILEKNFDNLEFLNLDDVPDEYFNNKILNSKGMRLLQERCKSVQNFKGVVVFYLSLESGKSAGADAQLFPLNGQFINLYINSVLKTDLPHEIGHILGLEHIFKEKKDYIENRKKNISYLEGELTKNKTLEGNEKYNQVQVLDNISKINQIIVEERRKIEEYKSILKNNKYKFTESSTTNLMDYRNEGKDFYHWQWLVMQQEINTYYK
ncbi:type VI secretion system tube protein TssD [Aquimarina sp. RZ0]|uniref:type VI secretion system tube protein TssD n=1 Tax=Aquimarina sp. RZ0 TaxID=2607730 RepID=UPI0011F0B7CB|nr:type VI secretion system tube protein TssD [Aquimarina sp. RZ0]KAA1243014.1 hypothetical protein F0000_22900 [Aquimarina sp. RZ0]